MADVISEVESRIFELGKTLRCPICLNIMDQPARLPCLHYFCWGCITHNVKPRGEVVCPVCRARSNRRDIQEDSLLATFTQRYGQIEAALGKPLHLSQLPPLEPLEPAPAATAAERLQQSPEDTRTTALTAGGDGEGPGSVHGGRGAAGAGACSGKGMGGAKPPKLDELWQSLIASQHQAPAAEGGDGRQAAVGGAVPATAAGATNAIAGGCRMCRTLKAPTASKAGPATAVSPVQPQSAAAGDVAKGCAGSTGGRWPAPCPGWVLLGSGLEEGPSGKGMVRKLAAAAGAKVVDAVGPAVTHVLCGTDSSRRARRTFKYLMGVANGCWVLDVGWAAACLSAGAHVLEADWQVVGDQMEQHQSDAGQDPEAAAAGPSAAEAACCDTLLHNTRVYLQACSFRTSHKPYDSLPR
eukprot:XP_001700107.1 predicted protein [Chlamydomonas reinhardtii]